MATLLRFKLRLKSERFTENVTIITERFKVLFDMSDIGHSRVLSKSQLFSFSAPSGCVFAVDCHTLLPLDIF